MGEEGDVGGARGSWGENLPEGPRGEEEEKEAPAADTLDAAVPARWKPC